MSRVEQIRRRLTTASRSFSWVGAAGVAMDDVTYLLAVVTAAEQLAAALNAERDEPGGNPLILRTYVVAPALQHLEDVLNRAPSSAGDVPVTGGARSGAVLQRRKRPW